jgi:hypothetical protein
MNATIAIEEKIIELVRSLPLAKQKQILDFAEFIGVYRLNHADLALTYPEAFAEQRFQPKMCSC